MLNPIRGHLFVPESGPPTPCGRLEFVRYGNWQYRADNRFDPFNHTSSWGFAVFSLGLYLLGLMQPARLKVVVKKRLVHGLRYWSRKA